MSHTFLWKTQGSKRVGEFMRISRYDAFARPTLDELKRKSLRGGFVSVGAQGAKLLLQTATLMLLARLLSVEDYGLQGMAMVLTGFLGVFGDAGLSAATIQRLEVTEEQISTLFWINVLVGVALGDVHYSFGSGPCRLLPRAPLILDRCCAGRGLCVQGSYSPAPGVDRAGNAFSNERKDRIAISRD